MQKARQALGVVINILFFTGPNRSQSWDTVVVPLKGALPLPSHHMHISSQFLDGEVNKNNATLACSEECNCLRLGINR